MTPPWPWGPVIFLGLCLGGFLCFLSWDLGWPAWAYPWRHRALYHDPELDDPIELYPADEWREQLRRIHDDDELDAATWRAKKGL